MLLIINGYACIKVLYVIIWNTWKVLIVQYLVQLYTSIVYNSHEMLWRNVICCCFFSWWDLNGNSFDHSFHILCELRQSRGRRSKFCTAGSRWDMEEKLINVKTFRLRHVFGDLGAQGTKRHYLPTFKKLSLWSQVFFYSNKLLLLKIHWSVFKDMFHLDPRVNILDHLIYCRVRRASS